MSRLASLWAVMNPTSRSAVDGDEGILAGPQPGQRTTSTSDSFQVGSSQLTAVSLADPVAGGQAGRGPQAGLAVPREGQLVPVSSWASTASGVASALRSISSHSVGAPTQPRAARPGRSAPR